MSQTLSEAALDQIFREARTFNAWQPKDVSDEQLHQLYELTKWAPTSANASPMRVVFVKSKEAKAKLAPFLSEANRTKTAEAPVTAIIGSDQAFYEQLPKLFPHADARSWFVGNQAMIEATAFRNSSLQGAYLLLAARSLGLRADVRLRPGGRRCRLLRRHDDQVQFPDQPRLRRCQPQHVSAQPAAYLR
jgi:3-hydroxypropanoate dehydrogenase